MSQDEKFALHHDPDYPEAGRRRQPEARTGPTPSPRPSRPCDDCDQSVKRALSRLQRREHGRPRLRRVQRARRRRPEDGGQAGTQVREEVTAVWGLRGRVRGVSPEAGAEAKASDVGGGKSSARPRRTRTSARRRRRARSPTAFKLAGEAEAFAGAKANIGAGITNEGLNAEAGAFAGGAASAQGSAYAGPVGVYGRAEGRWAPRRRPGSTSAGRLPRRGRRVRRCQGRGRGRRRPGGIGVGVTAEGYAARRRGQT